MKHRVEFLLEEERICLKRHQKEPEKEDPVEPEPVPDVELEKEKDPVASGSRCKRSTAPGHTRRKLTKKSKPWTQDMILEGVYWTDELETKSVEDGCWVSREI